MRVGRKHMNNTNNTTSYYSQVKHDTTTRDESMRDAIISHRVARACRMYHCRQEKTYRRLEVENTRKQRWVLINCPAPPAPREQLTNSNNDSKTIHYYHLAANPAPPPLLKIPGCPAGRAVASGLRIVSPCSLWCAYTIELDLHVVCVFL